MVSRRRIASLLTILTATAALCALLALPSAAVVARRVRPAASSAPIVGLISGVSQWADSSMASRLNFVLNVSGTKWLREGIYWSEVEPSPNHFDFRHYDLFMLLAAQHHVHVLGLLYHAPTWESRAYNELPKSPSAYARYVAAVVGRYGPDGSFWRRHPSLRPWAIRTYELWDEPYDDIGDNYHYNPARYAAMVKAAVPAGRAADRKARFLIGAEMQGAMVNNNWLWWVNALYRAVPNLNKYFDGVAVHPYGHDITGRAPAIPDAPYYGYRQMRRIEIIRQEFVQHGAASKPFWASEVGWPTCTTGSERCVSAAGQTASLQMMLHYMRTRWKSYVHVAFVYYLDDTSTNRTDSETQYGLLDFNDRPKPVLSVFRAAAKASPLNAW
jgi:hypothetical protein